jgi:hypothetical protein
VARNTIRTAAAMGCLLVLLAASPAARAATPPTASVDPEAPPMYIGLPGPSGSVTQPIGPGFPNAVFRYQADDDTRLGIDTIGSDFDTTITVYNGHGDVVAANDDISPSNQQSGLGFTLNAPHAYLIAVAGVAGATGTIVLNYRTPPGPPTAPTEPSAVVLGPTSVNVAFTPDFDGGSPATFYAQCRSITGGPARAASGPGSPLTVKGLVPGDTYTCRVRGTNGANGRYSDNTAPVVPMANVPSQPTAVTAGVMGTPTTARVNFTPGPSGGVPVSTFYAQCVSPTGGATKAKSGPAGPLLVTGLSLGHDYVCRVRATNAVGTGAYSAFSMRYTQQATPPPAPTGVNANLTQPGTVSVSYLEGPDGGSPITKYYAQCTSGSAQSTRAASGLSSPLVVSGLLASPYQCRVRAVNAVGTGPFSDYTSSFPGG